MNETITQRTLRRRKRRGRIRDFVLYIAAGVGVAAAAMLVGYRTTIEPNLLVKWLGFAAMTALVFGDTIRTNWRAWGRQRRFWLVLAAFLAVQCTLGALVLSTVTKVPTIIWALLIPLDYAALSACLGFFLDSQRD